MYLAINLNVERFISLEILYIAATLFLELFVLKKTSLHLI